jgi:integrase
MTNTVFSTTMASIHQHARSPYWFCTFTLPDGRRAFRSTKQRERKKAFDVCRAWEKAGQKAREGELTELATRKVLDDLLESVGSRTGASESVRTFSRSWLESRRLVVSAKTAQHYQQVLTAFLVHLGVGADRTLASVTPAVVAAYRDARLGRDHICSGTLARDLQVIRSMFRLARARGLISHNPADREVVSLPSTQSMEREVFSPAELAALLSAAADSPEWKTLVLSGFFLGGRLVDMARLSWDDVDLAAGLVT